MNDKAALIAVICGALGLLMIFAEITGHGKKDKSLSSSVIVSDITTTTDTATDTTTNTTTTTETITETAKKTTTTAKITTSKETTTTSNTTTTTDTTTETTTTTDTPTETTTTETTDAITDKQYDDYVLNTSTMKYHIPSCSSVGDIAPENRQDVYTTSDDLEAQGYEPCGRCKPR